MGSDSAFGHDSESQGRDWDKILGGQPSQSLLQQEETCVGDLQEERTGEDSDSMYSLGSTGRTPLGQGSGLADSQESQGSTKGSQDSARITRKATMDQHAMERRAQLQAKARDAAKL